MYPFTAKEETSGNEKAERARLEQIKMRLKYAIYPDFDAGTPIYDQLKAEQAAQERAEAIKDSFRADLAQQKLHYGTFI